MRPKEQSYSTYFTIEDRMYVNLITQPRRGRPARLLRYYIRYQTWSEGEWKDVVEYDNCHDEVHQHDYDREGVKGAAQVLGANDDPKRSCQELQEKMAATFKKHKEWYNQR